MEEVAHLCYHNRFIRISKSFLVNKHILFLSASYFSNKLTKHIGVSIYF